MNQKGMILEKPGRKIGVNTSTLFPS